MKLAKQQDIRSCACAGNIKFRGGSKGEGEGARDDMRLSNITDILKKKFLSGVPLLGKLQNPPLQWTFRNHQGLVGFAKGDS